MGNTVNADNFNETMQGYTDRAIDEMVISLKEEGFTEKQLDKIIKSFKNGLRWSKDFMTMSDAREYKRKY
jgi:hypothetical protein